MKVRFSPAATTDAKEIYNFIANDDPTAAQRVIDRIAQTIQLLAEFPRLGHAGIVPQTLELLVPGLPYVVVYEVGDGEEILILRLYHAAQDRR